MTLSRYLGREVLLHFLGVLAVVVGIFLVQRLDALLAEAAEGALSLGVAGRVLALRTLASLPSLCPVVLYLAVVLALGRLSRDRELVALASCGLSPWRVARPIFALAVLASVLIGWLALDVRPRAARALDEVERQARLAVDLGGLAPGRFYALGDDAERVLFAERRLDGPSGAVGGVFLHEVGADGVSVIASERAVEDRDVARGDRLLRLQSGRRYDISADGDEIDATDFAEYVLRTPLDDAALEGNGKVAETAALLGSDAPADQAELQWRLSMPVSALLLVLVALPLGRSDPRAGKYGRLLVALLVYVGYRQLLGTVKGMMAVGEVAPLPGLWAVHGLLPVVAAALVVAARARAG